MILSRPFSLDLDEWFQVLSAIIFFLCDFDLLLSKAIVNHCRCPVGHPRTIQPRSNHVLQSTTSFQSIQASSQVPHQHTDGHLPCRRNPTENGWQERKGLAEKILLPHSCLSNWLGHWLVVFMVFGFWLGGAFDLGINLKMVIRQNEEDGLHAKFKDSLVVCEFSLYF